MDALVPVHKKAGEAVHGPLGEGGCHWLKDATHLLGSSESEISLSITDIPRYPEKLGMKSPSPC